MVSAPESESRGPGSSSGRQARHITLTVPPLHQGNLTKCLGGGEGATCDGLASHPGGVAILLVVSCDRNQDKLRQLREPGS